MNKTYLLRSSILLALLLAIVSACSTPSSAPAKTVTTVVASSLCQSWSVVPGALPEPGLGENELTGVAAISTNNAWTVGYQSNTDDSAAQTLIEHWNGTAWSFVPSPNVASLANFLQGVTVVSASDIWAVGYTLNNLTATSQTLLEHWNGQTWSVVPSPNADHVSMLNGVVALSSTNIWAVGSSEPKLNGTHHTLVLHYDGSRWQVVPSPNASSDSSQLTAITALSANDLWAVGFHGDSDKGAGLNQTLIEHWNGSAWKVVPSPNVKAANDNLNGISGTSPSDLWAVGSTFNFATVKGQTLIEHFDGSTWSIVKSPNQGSVNNLEAVTVLPSGFAWAVGSSYTNGPTNSQTLIELWDGHTWSIDPSSIVSAADANLEAVAPAPQSSQVWTVGIAGSRPAKTLIQAFCQNP